MKKFAYINPQLFADEGAAGEMAGGGGIDTGTAAETGTLAESVNVGDTLSDGSQVQDPQVAAAMNKRLKQHPELRQAFFGQRAQQEPAAQGEQPTAEPTPEEWAEAKKKYAKFYGNDVQNAVRDRFKNQADANEKLKSMDPMIQALMKKTGVESVEELQDLILNDDSLYEEEAEQAGMTVEAYKNFKKLQDEHDQMVANERQTQERQQMQQHIAGIRQQAEEMQKLFPGFNLDQELQNPEFIKLTSPGGISVKQAYFALHGDEMIPNLMAYGMQRAQQQMGQTIMAQKARPAEGAMNSKNPAAAEPRINPKNLSRPEMNKIKQLIRMDKFTSFDR